MANSIQEKSNYVRDWIRSVPWVKEESLTDWLLYEMLKNCAWIKGHTHTRNREKETGADWEWWFVSDDGVLGLRVQAKRLREDAWKNYRGLSYPKRTRGQIGRLIKTATEAKPEQFPLYVFYAADDRVMLRCGRRGRGGVFVASAYEVEAMLPLGIAPTVSLLENSFPLQCLLGCPLACHGVQRKEATALLDPVERVRHFLQLFFSGSFAGVNQKCEVPEVAGRGELPEYADRLLNGESDVSLPSEIEACLTVDLRESEDVPDRQDVPTDPCGVTCPLAGNAVEGPERVDADAIHESVPRKLWRCRFDHEEEGDTEPWWTGRKDLETKARAMQFKWLAFLSSQGRPGIPIPLDWNAVAGPDRFIHLIHLICIYKESWENYCVSMERSHQELLDELLDEFPPECNLADVPIPPEV